jgi:hypothetical protein
MNSCIIFDLKLFFNWWFVHKHFGLVDFHNLVSCNDLLSFCNSWMHCCKSSSIAKENHLPCLFIFSLLSFPFLQGSRLQDSDLSGCENLDQSFFCTPTFLFCDLKFSVNWGKRIHVQFAAIYCILYLSLQSRSSISVRIILDRDTPIHFCVVSSPTADWIITFTTPKLCYNLQLQNWI